MNEGDNLFKYTQSKSSHSQPRYGKCEQKIKKNLCLCLEEFT